MSTTDTCTATITLTDTEADPCAGHEPETGLALPTPSPLTLVRFATSTNDPDGPHGRLAFCLGTQPGEAPSLWKAAELIRFLAVVAGRRTVSGLALDIPARLLDQEFGQGRVARFEDVDFPATLTHEPTRGFLRETGLPEEAFPFHLDADVPPLTLTEHYTDVWPGELSSARLPAGADHLIRIGELADGSSVVVEGATGAVLTWGGCDTTPAPLTTDVSALAATLWLLRRR